jgi:hypothetical protein
MITSAWIAALNRLDDGTARPDPYRWITALRPRGQEAHGRGWPAAAQLFGEQDLAEITSPDVPGERLIACRHPVPAADRARTRTREELLAATEKLPPPHRPRPGRRAHRRRANPPRGGQGDKQI